MTKNTKVFISVFLPFVKQKAENLCLKNCHFKTISGHFWPTIQCLSQNWGSDGHFEVLNMSKSKLDQNLWYIIG